MVDYSKLQEKKSNRAKILGEIIRKKGLRFNKIVDRVGLSKRIVSSHLEELKEKRLIEKKGGRFGKYVATKKGIKENRNSDIKARALDVKKSVEGSPVFENPDKAGRISATGTISVKPKKEEKLKLENPVTTENGDLMIRIPASYLTKAEGGYVSLGWRRKNEEKQGKRND